MTPSIRIIVLALSVLLPSGAALAQTNGARVTTDNHRNGAVTTDTNATAIELNIGEQRVLSAAGVKTYSEGVKGVVDVRLTGDASRFVIIGLAKGTTSLLLIMVDGTERIISITVRDPRDTGEVKAGPNPLAVSPQASIRLDLYFVQVNRSNSTDYGMNPGTLFGSANFALQYSIPAAALVSKTAVVGTQFLPQLEMAQARGWAKVSRHIAVITSNGTQANFDSGGEFNTLGAQTGLVQTVVSVKYGTTLNIQPRYDANTGRIELAVSAQVADLTPSAGSIPGRTKSSVETIANLALGESLAIAGLVAANEERTRTGVPYLSQIPLLGLLFGKQASKESETENLVFIAPSVVEPLKHARAKEFLSNAMREYQGYSGSIGAAELFPGAPWAMPNQRLPVAD